MPVDSPKLNTEVVVCWLCGKHVPWFMAFCVGHTSTGIPHFYCDGCHDSYVASRYDYEAD